MSELLPCPNCDGSGAISTTTIGVEAGCCGNTLRSGECCGNAIPVPVPVQDIEPCQWCAEKDEVINKIKIRVII